MAEFKLKIPEMMCEHCEKRIRGAVAEAGGSVKSLDLSTKEVVAEFPGDAEKLLAVIDGAGYDAKVM
ncbi:heavy-metal-associated domain-containing protein [Synergistes jonesii]|uniref:heavy-metal-associated domain-containing protein n=1 Tax=Synergistes jonesii TaxID=2754 RepID=UPI00248DDCDC|nr:heavy-metal-associated domain-containing protein [Synergistes jonesii]